MLRPRREAFEPIRVYQTSGSLNAAAGTVDINPYPLFIQGYIDRIIVRRTAGDATNFGIELRDDLSASADDDNRWFYIASAVRTKYDGIPDAPEFLNREAAEMPRLRALLDFSGGTAIVQTYEVSIWGIAYR